MRQEIEKYVRKTGALLLGIVVAVACVRYSAYFGIPAYLAVDWLFPAISAETINTATTNGLTPPTHNLAFLVFALLAGSMISAVFWKPDTGYRREKVACIIGFVALCFISSANFWPREQLIQMHAQALIDVTLVAIASYVLVLLRRIKVTTAVGQLGKYTFILLTTIFGLALPALFGSVALIAGFGVPVGDVYQYTFLLVTIAVTASLFLILRTFNTSQKSS